MVGWKREDTGGKALGDGTGVLGVCVGREVGQEGIEVAASEDIVLFAEAGVDAFACGEVLE